MTDARPDALGERNRAAFRAMAAMFTSGDAARADSTIAAGYVDHEDHRGRSGRAGFVEMIEAVHELYPDLSVEIDDLLAEGDRVAARLRWSGTHARTGEAVRAQSLEIVRFEDARAVQHWGLNSGWPRTQ